jgi:hypothetical protein
MDPNVAAKLRNEFPDAEDLAWDRVYADGTIFYNTKTHRRLPGFTDRKILTALMFANSLAAGWGASLKFSIEEKKLWSRHFLIAAALVILGLFFNYFSDSDHDEIPDLIEQLLPAATLGTENLVNNRISSN